jgi:hypothetical protein
VLGGAARAHQDELEPELWPGDALEARDLLAVEEAEPLVSPCQDPLCVVP